MIRPMIINPVNKSPGVDRARPAAGAFWQGQDGNVWVAGENGVNSAGTWDANTANYWGGQGFNQINDPNANRDNIGSMYFDTTRGTLAVDRGDGNVDYGTPMSGNVPSRNNTVGSGSGGGGAADPNQVALYDQAIRQYQNSLGQYDQQRDVGLGNIENAYQRQLERLMQGRATTEGRFKDQQLQTTQDNVKARSNVDALTGRNMNALQRLLGARGAGASSAAEVAAPYAAALQGTQQQNEIADTYANNMGGLQQSFEDYEDRFNQSREDLGQQRYQQRNQLNQQVKQGRMGVNQSIADLQAQRTLAAGGNGQRAAQAAQPFLDRINRLQPEITQLGRQFGQDIRAQAPSYESPDLSQYRFDRGAAPGMNTGAMTDTVAPGYLGTLLGNRDRERQQRR